MKKIWVVGVLDTSVSPPAVIRVLFSTSPAGCIRLTTPGFPFDINDDFGLNFDDACRNARNNMKARSPTYDWVFAWLKETA